MDVGLEESHVKWVFPEIQESGGSYAGLSQMIVTTTIHHEDSMAGVPQKTLNWLWDVLRREYRDPQRAYSDLAQTLSAYPTFSPRTDVYTAENGQPALLVHLKGTLPVTFRGSPYRFPIAIWIPLAYPHESPILYVTPTDGMMIRPGQHVSGSDGRIYHPYLAQWRDGWERANIIEVLKLLAEIFAREPPVMSKPAIPPSQQVQQRQPPPPPRPPPREDRSRPQSQVLSSPISPPPLPPLPREIQQSNGARPSRYDAPLPLPQDTPRNQQSPVQPRSFNHQPSNYQPQRQTSLTHGHVQSATNLNDRYSSPAPLPPQVMQNQPPPPAQLQFQQAPPSARPQEQYQPQAAFAPQRQQQIPAQSVQQMQNYPMQVQRPIQMPQPGPPFPQPQPSQAQQKPATRPAPDLMDESPFDLALPRTTNPNLPTPVIPPNPEKAALLSTLSQTILQNLHSQVSQSASAIPALESQQTALSTASNRLQQELAQLQSLQSQLQSNIASLNSALASADRTIKGARSDTSTNKLPTVDESIIPTSIVAKQLYETVAEQRGYEAAIQALNEGFVRGRIGAEIWSRKCRECSREEFRKKWLTKRIGKGMGLDSS